MASTPPTSKVSSVYCWLLFPVWGTSEDCSDDTTVLSLLFPSTCFLLHCNSISHPFLLCDIPSTAQWGAPTYVRRGLFHLLRAWFIFFLWRTPVCAIWANHFPFSYFFFQMTSFLMVFLFQCTLICSFNNFSVLQTLRTIILDLQSPVLFPTPALLIGRQLVRPYSRHTLLVKIS
jgi:hypothetical protein